MTADVCFHVDTQRRKHLSKLSCLARDSDGALFAQAMANLATKILDFIMFDSNIILSLRGGILRPMGNSRESLSQGIVAGILLVGRLGVASCAPRGSYKGEHQPSGFIV